MKVFGGLLVIGLAALWGCATGGDKQCEVVGVGTGACCDLVGSDGQSRRGACINGVCTDGVESDPFNVACGSGGSSRRDQGGGLILDASAAGGMGGGQGGVGGGAGGAGGVGGGVGGMGGVGGGAGGAGGGMGGAGGGMGGAAGGMGGAGGGMGGAGGGGDLCAGVVCDPGERCNPMTGNCQERPAGGCEADGDCTVGMCLAEADTEGAIPGGFCRVECSDDGDCDGARCLPSGETNLCFQVCGPARACRDGWACLPTTGEDGEPDGGSICLPDCRVPAVGCQAGFVCNEGTGACEVAPPECRYPCQAGEECRDERCIRANGTCTTDYHCELNQQCRNGRCIVAEFEECLNPNQCSPPDQTCLLFNNGLDGGLCLFSCANDDQCPLDRTCFVNDRVCYWRTCGPSEENGTVFGSCNTGGQNQWQGTCLPVQVPQPGDPQIGLCLEAGNVPEGGACDAQVEGRGPADRALQCGPGMLCFDDPDDALNPARDFAGRGACRQLCDPRQDRCDTPGRACIDFSTLDDPGTPANETRYLGLCLQTDCTVARNDCAGGQQCRPYSLVAREGQCTAAGQAALGQACTTSNDCADSAFCANAGAGPVCLQICDPAAPQCAAGTECRNEPGWGFGVCL